MKRFINALTTCSIFFISSLTYANNLSVVDSNSCKKLKGTDKPFMLVLKRGENVTQSILQCANDAELPSATLIGLGALENPTLEYYDFSAKKFQGKTFSGIYELLSLNGDITQSKDKRVIHIHVGLGNDQYNMIGGHLSNALIGVTGEITVIPFKGKLIKRTDKETGLELISPAG